MHTLISVALLTVACTADPPDPVTPTGDTDTFTDTDTGTIDPDPDGDGVLEPDDPDNDDPLICGDTDLDGCDDCTVAGRPDPADDGHDHDGDGICEFPLDPECLHGAAAGVDPHRRDACVLLALANLDRALFADESGAAAPLTWNENVWLVAMGHSQNMCHLNFFDHVDPGGNDPSDRAEEAGFDFDLAENIAINWDVFWTHYTFMAEPTCIGHRGNILEPRAAEAGIAVFECDNQQSPWRGALYTTQNFIWDWARPESAWCVADDNACQLPPDPVSEALAWCPPDSCDPVQPSLLAEWGCL